VDLVVDSIDVHIVFYTRSKGYMKVYARLHVYIMKLFAFVDYSV